MATVTINYGTTPVASRWYPMAYPVQRTGRPSYLMTDARRAAIISSTIGRVPHLNTLLYHAGGDSNSSWQELDPGPAFLTRAWKGTASGHQGMDEMIKLVTAGAPYYSNAAGNFSFLDQLRNFSAAHANAKVMIVMQDHPQAMMPASWPVQASGARDWPPRTQWKQTGAAEPGTRGGGDFYNEVWARYSNWILGFSHGQELKRVDSAQRGAVFPGGTLGYNGSSTTPIGGRANLTPNNLIDYIEGFNDFIGYARSQMPGAQVWFGHFDLFGYGITSTQLDAISNGTGTTFGTIMDAVVNESIYRLGRPGGTNTARGTYDVEMLPDAFTIDISIAAGNSGGTGRWQNDFANQSTRTNLLARSAKIIRDRLTAALGTDGDLIKIHANESYNDFAQGFDTLSSDQQAVLSTMISMDAIANGVVSGEARWEPQGGDLGSGGANKFKSFQSWWTPYNPVTLADMPAGTVYVYKQWTQQEDLANTVPPGYLVRTTTSDDANIKCIVAQHPTTGARTAYLVNKSSSPITVNFSVSSGVAPSPVVMAAFTHAVVPISSTTGAASAFTFSTAVASKQAFRGPAASARPFASAGLGRISFVGTLATAANSALGGVGRVGNAATSAPVFFFSTQGTGGVGFSTGFQPAFQPDAFQNNAFQTSGISTVGAIFTWRTAVRGIIDRAGDAASTFGFSTTAAGNTPFNSTGTSASSFGWSTEAHSTPIFNAFQANAFQINAFQVAAPVGAAGGSTFGWSDAATGTAFDQITGTSSVSFGWSMTTFLDTYTRVVTPSWGTADNGQTYTGNPGTIAGSSVDGSVGIFLSDGANQTRRYQLGPSITNFDIVVDFMSEKLAVGSDVSIYIVGRNTVLDTDAYRLRILRDSVEGGLVLYIEAWVEGIVSQLASAAPAIDAAGTWFTARFRGWGTSPTALSAKVWTRGTTEPAFQLSAVDGTGPQTAGPRGLRVYSGEAPSNLPFKTSFDNLSGNPNQAIEAFTGTASASFGWSTTAAGKSGSRGVAASAFTFETASVGVGIILITGNLAIAFPFATVGAGHELFTATSASAFGFSSANVATSGSTGTSSVSFGWSTLGAGGGNTIGDAASEWDWSTSGRALLDAFVGQAASTFTWHQRMRGPGSAPPGLTGAIEYVLEIFSPGLSFGPGTKVGEVWDARNIGWSRYDRLPGKAFLSLYQDSPHLSKFSPLLTHIKIWRVTPTADTLVYSGGYIDYDSTGDDVILSFFDYVSLLAISRSGYRALYPKKRLGTEIVQPEIDLAIAKAFSPLGFITRGTIEDPLGNDGLTTILTNSEFGLLDQTRLQVFYDISEMGRANTKNHVTFQVTRTPPYSFYFLKDAGTARNIGLTLNGTVNDYEYLPNWGRYRNDIASLGTTVGGGATEIVKTDEAAAAARGRRQDVATIKTLLGIVTATTEADQQQAATGRILNIATQRTAALAVRLERGTLAPFDGWDIADTVPMEIVNGVDNLVSRQRIVGVRGLYTEAGEDLSLVLEPILL